VGRCSLAADQLCIALKACAYITVKRSRWLAFEIYSVDSRVSKCVLVERSHPRACWPGGSSAGSVKQHSWLPFSCTNAQHCHSSTGRVVPWKVSGVNAGFDSNISIGAFLSILFPGPIGQEAQALAKCGNATHSLIGCKAFGHTVGAWFPGRLQGVRCSLAANQPHKFVT